MPFSTEKKAGKEPEANPCVVMAITGKTLKKLAQERWKHCGTSRPLLCMTHIQTSGP